MHGVFSLRFNDEADRSEVPRHRMEPKSNVQYSLSHPTPPSFDLSFSLVMFNFIKAPHFTQGIDPVMRGRELQALVDRFTESFPPRLTLNGSAFMAPRENVYLLTGTTGCLGSNMLAQLLEATATMRVYAFNRPSKTTTLRARQLSSFKQRGLNRDLLSSEKLVYVEGDLSAPGFALDRKLYGEVSTSPGFGSLLRSTAMNHIDP